MQFPWKIHADRNHWVNLCSFLYGKFIQYAAGNNWNSRTMFEIHWHMVWLSISHQIAARNENQHSIEIVFTHTKNTQITLTLIQYTYIVLYVLGWNQERQEPAEQKSCCHFVKCVYENTCHFTIFHNSHFAFCSCRENLSKTIIWLWI